MAKQKTVRGKTKAELKAEAIAACRDKHGRITPKTVWQTARNDPSNYLHDHGGFVWDVQRAAEESWERRAAELIREVRMQLEIIDVKVVVPMYVSDPRQSEKSYVATSFAARNAALSSKVMRDELDRIKGAIHRAASLAAVFGLSSTFERMLEEIVVAEARLGVIDSGSKGRSKNDSARHRSL